jgi:protein-S-isoprenylcysteine O-methyltransferase Ste14
LAGQAIVLVLIATFALLGPRWPDPLASPLRIVGLMVAAVGCVLAASAGMRLGRSLTPLPKPREGGTLSDQGVYALVRHPMYGGVLLAAIGLSLVTSPAALIPTAVGFVFLELKSEREETWLVERYPEYRPYRRRVRWKFVPGIR